MFKTFYIISFLFTLCYSYNENPFYEKDLKSDHTGIKKIKGDIKFSKKGLYLSGDSKIKLISNKKLKTADGSIDISVIPPDLSNKTLLPLTSPYECYCALKIRTGLGLIEISDKWIIISHFKSDLSTINEQLFFKTMEMDNAGIETDIRLEFLNRTLKLTINDMTVTTLPFFYSDLKDVELSSFKHDFIITAISMSEIFRDTISIDFNNRTVDVAAAFHPDRFNNKSGLKNHHFVVWQKGKAAPNTLLETYASDSLIYKALLKAGAKPGNNLTIDTWEKISNKKSKEPDKKVDGSLIKVTFFHGFDTLEVHDLLKDKKDKSFEFRFGGNINFISHWRSGCVVCLQSCPGGKIGNRTYTMRDLHKKIPLFEKQVPSNFKQSDEITIRFTIID